MTQEALARAYVSWSSVSSMERPDLWVMRVLTNLAHSRLRRIRLERRLRPRSNDRSFGFEESVSSNDYLVNVLKKLSRRQREALVLRYCMDFPIAEVSRVMGIREGTVQALTAQGLAKLRTELRLGELGG